MARVMVTGGAGFIGSHLVDRLLYEGHRVAVIDDLSTGTVRNLQSAQQNYGRLLDIQQLSILSDAFDSAVARFSPDVVMHLAAQMDVRHSVADPVYDAAVNVVGTVCVLEACRHHDVEKIVFATSGGCIYGEPPQESLPIAETYPGRAHSPYGAAKRAAEEYLITFSLLYGLRWTSLALGNVVGTRQDPAGEAGVVAIFGGLMLEDQAVTIYGDGKQTRDFVYVDDVADAFLLAMERGDGFRINIGSGQQTSINKLFLHIAAMTAYERQPRYAPERPGELQHIALDCALAQRELGWVASTTLHRALEKTVVWLAESHAAAAVPGTPPGFGGR
jgi:UDP-glucose 4-epimerase